MKLVYFVGFIGFLLLSSNNLFCQATEDNSEDDNNDFSEVMTNEENTENVQKEEIGVSASQDVVLKISTGGHSGVTYTRFGKNSCPSEATLVYEGFAAGGWYHQKGNGANYLCMPRDPQYLSTTHVPWPSYLYGAEYQTNNQIFNKRTQDYNVPCAVCYRGDKSTKLMIPAKTSCPSQWSREYYGYLMTSYHSHEHSVQYECVDYNPDLIPGTQANTDGALFYFVQVECNRGLPCGPYVHRRPVTCTVCTK